MKWTKKGRIYIPDGRLWWAKKYAFPPTPYFLKDQVLRIYVSFCDENTIGRVGYVEVDAEDPANVLRVSSRPVLDIGTPGAFDENGVLPTCVVPVEDRLYLYYVGYQLGYRVRYFQFEGLAVSKDGGESFQRCQRTPVIDRSENELVNRTSSFVMREGGVFKMWYVGGSDWRDVHGKMLPVYKLRYLESSDGIHWPPEGRVCLDFRDADEHAFGRPWVFRRSERYGMFYSVRTHSRGYRLGYAESPDGVNWQRMDDKIGLDVSPSGWDSQMMAYSSLVHYHGRTYLFYNGNNCGETGFGYALLEEW
jgi:predicted GH43/DUF377 family glycosyl hydrolase